MGSEMCIRDRLAVHVECGHIFGALGEFGARRELELPLRTSFRALGLLDRDIQRWSGCSHFRVAQVCDAKDVDGLLPLGGRVERKRFRAADLQRAVELGRLERFRQRAVVGQRRPAARVLDRDVGRLRFRVEAPADARVEAIVAADLDAALGGGCDVGFVIG